MVNKKINTKETKRIIYNLMINENINYNEYNNDDLLFFVSKDSEIIWLSYYFTHVGIIVKIDSKIYILDSDPLLTGKYLVNLNEYMNKYCGHIYFVKMKYTKDEQQIINNNIQKIISNEENNLITPDDLLIKNINKIVYIKKIKKENITNSCYHNNGIFNLFESLHPIEK